MKDYQAMTKAIWPEARLAMGLTDHQRRWWVVAAGYPYRECQWPNEAWEMAWQAAMRYRNAANRNGNNTSLTRQNRVGAGR